MKALVFLLAPILLVSGCIGQVPAPTETGTPEQPLEIGPQPGEQPPPPPGGSVIGSIDLRVPICQLTRIDPDNTRHFRIESAGSVSGTKGLVLRVSYSGDFTTTGAARTLECTAWAETSGGTECTRLSGDVATTGWEGTWGEHTIAPGAGRVTVQVRAELSSQDGSIVDEKTSITRCE